MKGKILGFDRTAGSGAIAAENGERFNFVREQWRGERIAATGMAVDFAPVAGVATEIYPVPSAMPAAADIASSPVAQKLVALGKSTLVFPLAALLLLATFLPALSSPVKSASLWGLGDVQRMISANPFLSNSDTTSIEQQLQRLDAAELDLKQHSTGFGGMPVDNTGPLQRIAEERQQLNEQLGSARTAGIVTSLLSVRWLVPILAAVLLWFCWSGRGTRTLAIGTGVVSLATAAIIYAWRGAIVGGGGAPEDSLAGMMGGHLSAMISIGFGTWLIGLLGFGLILTALELVKNPLALDR